MRVAPVRTEHTMLLGGYLSQNLRFGAVFYHTGLLHLRQEVRNISETTATERIKQNILTRRSPPRTTGEATHLKNKRGWCPISATERQNHGHTMSSKQIVNGPSIHPLPLSTVCPPPPVGGHEQRPGGAHPL